jgi:PAS domain S-box-containing protein
VPPETAVAAAAEDQLAALLEGDFLLTDGRGSVSRFGPRASALFGWAPEEILGRAALESLAVPGTAEEWRERLQTPEDPLIGIVKGSGRHVDGHEFDLEWLIVPVWLGQSLELSRMLEVIGAEGSAERRRVLLERDHAAALEAVRAAAAGTSTGADDRLAGFVLAFRALGETPWVEAALAPPPPETEPRPVAAAVVGPNDEQLLRVGELEHEVATLRGELGELRAALAAAQDAGAGAVAAQEDAAAARAAAEQALALSEETRMETERWRRELTERSRGEAADAVSDGAGAETRDGRPDFDDVETPLAVIALDGRFEALNPAFSDLVGYTEAEFRRARWPSIVDRDSLVEHRLLHSQLASGELEQARIETLYLHGQGLMVPVHGELELVREDGHPSHLLLRVDG